MKKIHFTIWCIFFLTVIFMPEYIEAKQELQFVGRITGEEYSEDTSCKKKDIKKAYIHTLSSHELENRLLTQAKNTYGYDVIIKNFSYSQRKEVKELTYNALVYYVYSTRADVYRVVDVPDPTPVVVTPPAPAKEEEKVSETSAVEKAISKALELISPGSRVAINTITTSAGLNRDQVKDILLDVLIDGSYKVVAKEYLERLKEELEEQQSGDYNDRTLVKAENFTAVGYFIDVKIKDKMARVYIINVSTGEYAATGSQSFQ